MAGGIDYVTKFHANDRIYDTVSWVQTGTTEDGDVVYSLSFVPTIDDDNLIDWGYPSGMTFKGWYFNAFAENYTVESLASVGLFGEYIDILDLDCVAWVEPKSANELPQGDIYYGSNKIEQLKYGNFEVEKVIFNDNIIWPKNTIPSVNKTPLFGSFSVLWGDWAMVENSGVNYPDGDFDVLQSNTNTGVDSSEGMMTIELENGFTSFSVYGYSDSEYSFDYLIAKMGSEPTESDWDFKIEGTPNNAIPSDINQWTEMRFTGIDPNVKTVLYFKYKKDSSTSNGLDKAFILVPTNQYEYN